MDGWVDVARVEDLEPGQGRTVTANGVRFALFNDGGRFLALDNECPHQGASLGEGLVHDGRVICPWHSWVFDLRTGRCPRDSHEGVRAHPTRCIDGVVQVNVQPTEPGQPVTET